MIESFGKIKRSDLVNAQVPSFIDEDHPTFVAFLEAYYEFLSQKSWVPSEQFIDYIDADKAPQEFIDHFWEEVRSIPTNVAADRRLLTKHIRDLYESKGSAKSIELLFRILYNEDVTVYEPKQDVLKPSDGKWIETDIIRTKVPIDIQASSLIGKKLYQYGENGAELCNFIVANVILLNSYSEFLYVEIVPTSVNGRVYSGYQLKNATKTISLEIVPSFGIDSYFHRGSLYSAGEIFYSGENPVYIKDIGSGPVDGVFLINGGSGYAVGDYLTVDESGTGGMGVSIRVEEIGPGGAAKKLRLVSGGLGYETMPNVTGNGSGVFVPWSLTSGRILNLTVKEAVSDNTPVNFITRAIVNRSSDQFVFGEVLEYTGNTVTLEDGLAILDEGGQIFASEDQPSGTPGAIGTVDSFDANLSSLYIKDNYGSGVILSEDDGQLLLEDGRVFSNEFITLDLDRYQIRGRTSGTVAEIIYVDPVVISTKLSPIFRQSAKYKNEDGFVASPAKRIQDSYYYQDYSYVIKSSYSFQNYKNILYKLIHPAGLLAFGQVEINTFVQNTFNRIKYAFGELTLKIQTQVASKWKPSNQAPSMAIKTDVGVVSGPTWSWIEKYKGILGNQYSSATYGSDDLPGSAQAYYQAIDAQTADPFVFGNTPASFLSSYSLEDLMQYADDFSSTKTLILDGSFKLDGTQDLDGVNNIIDTTVQTGKFRAKRNRRIVWQLDAEIKKVPLNPTDDIAFTTDSLFYTLYSAQSESPRLTDSASGASTFNRFVDEVLTTTEVGPGASKTSLGQVNEILSTSDVLASSFSSVGPVSKAAASEAIANLGLDAPKDKTGVTETLTFVLSSSSSINSSPINSSSL